MYRDLGNIDDEIIKTVLQMGAKEGVLKVVSKKVAAKCGIASYTIFSHYKSMQNLLDAAAQSFDRFYMQYCLKLIEAKLPIEEVWDRMLDVFIQNPDGTLYYISYTNAFGFDPTINNPRAEEFLQITKAFFQTEKSLTDDQYLILWDYVTSMAFYYAEKFIHYMEYNEENKNYVKQIVFKGIIGILHY